jgi:hypothetical protein
MGWQVLKNRFFELNYKAAREAAGPPGASDDAGITTPWEIKVHLI